MMVYGMCFLWKVEELLEGMLVLANYLVGWNVRPDDWVQHRIQYIPKAAETCDHTQMRPVSLTYVLSKWFERLLQPRLEGFVSNKLFVG